MNKTISKLSMAGLLLFMLMLSFTFVTVEAKVNNRAVQARMEIGVTPISLRELPTTQSMKTTTSLNLRKGMGTKYRVITVVPKGKEVTVLTAGKSGWTKVKYGGRIGYVSSKYLTSKIASTAPATKYAPMTMHLPGKTLNFKNGGTSKGQSIIDSNTSLISTWGGAATFSGTDGKNTHFIGHNPGAFNGIWEYSLGTVITVVDHNGVKTSYSISDKFLVDDYGVRLDSKKPFYNYIASASGGEVITLQTCKNDTENWIIRAKKVS